MNLLCIGSNATLLMVLVILLKPGFTWTAYLNKWHNVTIFLYIFVLILIVRTKLDNDITL